MKIPNFLFFSILFIFSILFLSTSAFAVENLTTVAHQTSVDIDWDDYPYADKYSIYEMEDGFPYVDTEPIVDGVKDVIYDSAHEFLIFSPNPINTSDYETIYPLRTSLGAYLLIESVDNDYKQGDDDTIYYFDLDNNGLNTNDYTWKITDNIVKRYHWDGSSWKVSLPTSAVGASTGAGTHYPIHELFIPIAELGVNWTNDSTIKILVQREDSALVPDVVTWYPYGNINDTDTTLWQEMVLNDLDSYTWLANVTLSNYTAIDLTPFTIYHGAISTWNGTSESEYTLFDVITEDLPKYNASGYILDENGNGIYDAVVYSCNDYVTEITITNESGYWIGYDFRDATTYTICADAIGYNANSTSITIASADLTDVNIILTEFDKNPMPMNIYISLIIMSIILMFYSFIWTDNSNYTHIISSIISAFINFMVGITSYSGVVKIIAAGNTLVEYVYQSSSMGTLFTILGLIMILFTVSKIYDIFFGGEFE